jgi:hypothetical protein
VCHVLLYRLQWDARSLYGLNKRLSRGWNLKENQLLSCTAPSNSQQIVGTIWWMPFLHFPTSHHPYVGCPGGQIWLVLTFKRSEMRSMIENKFSVICDEVVIWGRDLMVKFRTFANTHRYPPIYHSTQVALIPLSQEGPAVLMTTGSYYVCPFIFCSAQIRSIWMCSYKDGRVSTWKCWGEEHIRNASHHNIANIESVVNQFTIELRNCKFKGLWRVTQLCNHWTLDAWYPLSLIFSFFTTTFIPLSYLFCSAWLFDSVSTVFVLHYWTPSTGHSTDGPSGQTAPGVDR